VLDLESLLPSKAPLRFLFCLRAGLRAAKSIYPMMGKEIVSSNLDTATADTHNSGMKRPLLSGIAVLVALAALTHTAPACGDPPAQGVASDGEK
jgi:hypothetical protein